MLAKEVVVGSLNTLYSQMAHLSQGATSGFDFLGSLQTALWSIPHNLAELGAALINPIGASAPDSEISSSVYGVMYQHFDGQAGAYAYLLFILLYIPCVSTMAAIRQEASRKLMWFSITWSFIVAYAAAVFFYQLATILRHPEQTVAWLLGIIFVVSGVVVLIRLVSVPSGGHHAVANS
jgi:ferrous iron transport protein B